MIGWRVILVIPFALNCSCATPAPHPADYYIPQVPETDIGLVVDLDLLATAKLSDDNKRTGEKLLILFHSAETAFECYIEMAESSIEANEQLKEKYATTEAIVGGVAGISSPAIIFATAAVAIPIAGALYIGVGQMIQTLDIKPQLRLARDHIDEARRITHVFPDIGAAFRGLVFAPSESEAERRFKQWSAYIEGVVGRVSRFFTEPSH
ncbi:MAG: hypothetical protein KJS98_10840 [Nitrospirae bacterium]|nr:hypothetical protein [Nitrospirota bacterium]